MTPKKKYLLRSVPFQTLTINNGGAAKKRKTIDVTGSNIVFDWESLGDVSFVANAIIGTNKTFFTNNISNAISGTFSFVISSSCSFIMQSNFYVSGFLDWNSSTKTLNLNPGKYLINFFYDGADFYLTLDGPL